MKKQRPNPFLTYTREQLYPLTARYDALVVFWHSNIGLTADGFTFFADTATAARALRDLGSIARHDHGFDLKRRQSLPNATPAAFFECSCGCGMVAVPLGGGKFELYQNLEEFEAYLTSLNTIWAPA